MISKSAIFDFLKNGKVLVFPREISARSWLTGYSKEENTAVFADCAVSWDIFKEQFTEKPKSLKPASGMHRLLFSYYLLKSGKSEELNRFSNPEYPESISAFAKNLARNLVYFKRAVRGSSSEKLSDRLLGDVKIILEEYNRFLAKNGLYEKEFLVPDFSKADKDRYILVFPSTIEDFAVTEALEAGLKFIDTDESTELCPINVFENSICEIRAVVRKIRDLLQTVKPSDIVVSLNQFDSYLPYFRSECNKRNIKLNIQQGNSLYSYACGTFFRSIKELYNSDCDTDSLKKLLLNPVFPFRNRELISDVLKTGIECRIRKSVKNWNFKLKKLTEDGERTEEKLNFVNNLWNVVERIATCRNAEDLRSSFHDFQDRFFEQNSWHGLENQEEKKAFERAIILIDDLDGILRECSLENTTEFYDLFLTALSLQNYTPDKKNEGISVYSYPQSRGLLCQEHFVLGLSDSAVQQKRQVVPFADSLNEEDAEFITDAILKSYAFRCDNRFLSCATESFSAVSSEPALFSEKNLVVKINSGNSDCKDSFNTEENLWNGTLSKAVNQTDGILCSHNQKEWFDLYKSVFLTRLKGNTFATVDLPLILSATQMSDFSKCPYRWLCHHIYKLEEQTFSADMSDNLKIGNVLHETYRDFFETVKYFDQFSLEDNQTLLKEIFSRKLKSRAELSDAPDRIHIFEIQKKFEDIIGSICFSDKKNMFGLSYTDSMEKEFTIKDGNFVFTGRVDCIMKLNNGNFAVIDFKTGTVDASSFQLVIYANMLKENQEYGKYPAIGAFYSVKNAKFTYGWNNSEEFEERNTAFEALKSRILTLIRNSDFSCTPSKDNCENCPYPSVCRKRYVIK